MAIVFLEEPPKIAAAFNEMPLVVQTPKGRYEQLTKDLQNASTAEEFEQIQAEMSSLEGTKNQNTIDPITLYVVIGDDSAMTRTVILTPDPGPDGKARIDLSYIMRRAFVDVTRYTDARAQIDYNLMARWYIFRGPSVSGKPKPYNYALNAVYQLGSYDSAKGLNSFAKLTDTPLIRYEGYPFLITFRIPIPGNDIYYYRWELNGYEVVESDLPSPIVNVLRTADESSVSHLRVTRNNTTLGYYPISEGCVPQAPFYVRWINTQGGWNSWMFELRENADQVDDLSTIQRSATNPNDTQTTVALSASRKVTVGEGLLSKDEYCTLAALPRSPRIQWYNEELQAWQTIVVAEGFSAAWNSRNGFGNVEFTFALPRILTQF